MSDITEYDIKALKQAIVSGERVVNYKDRRVEYRSLEEMKEALSFALSEQSGTSGRRRIHPEYDSGL